MPAVATGAVLANKHLLPIGVSGDGRHRRHRRWTVRAPHAAQHPTHLHRGEQRLLRLTKGKLSTPIGRPRVEAEDGVVNDCRRWTWRPGHQLGATFVARSFSGDKKQLSALLKAAIAHKGTVLLDVLSPCVTFNRPRGSTRATPT